MEWDFGRSLGISQGERYNDHFTDGMTDDNNRSTWGGGSSKFSCPVQIMSSHVEEKSHGNSVTVRVGEQRSKSECENCFMSDSERKAYATPIIQSKKQYTTGREDDIRGWTGPR
jgi:hypothetical protein